MLSKRQIKHGIVYCLMGVSSIYEMLSTLICLFLVISLKMIGKNDHCTVTLYSFIIIGIMVLRSRMKLQCLTTLTHLNIINNDY